MENPYKLTLYVTWWMQIIQIIFALPFTIAAVFFLMASIRGSGQYWFLIIICILFAYMGWANAFSTIQITEESVTVNVLYGRFRILWSEVNRIVINAPLLALMGTDKRIVLSLAFAGMKSEELLRFFHQQCTVRNIVFEQSDSSFPITHHNARVWL
jgi:hypothetical protein